VFSRNALYKFTFYITLHYIARTQLLCVFALRCFAEKMLCRLIDSVEHARLNAYGT